VDTIWQELTAGLGTGTQVIRVAVRLILAMLLGAVVGYERERAGQWAGLRTHMLVALGSALLVVIPSVSGLDFDALSRVVQGIATGIGFIGAGSVLKDSRRREIRGLTTAAGIWVTAAVGVAAGLGFVGAAALSVLLAWLILASVGWLEGRIVRRRHPRPPRTGRRDLGSSDEPRDEARDEARDASRAG
jgi:putative Mg2+ transporter-C (MgtC) family protein